MDFGLDFYWDRGTAAGKPLIVLLPSVREKSLSSLLPLECNNSNFVCMIVFILLFWSFHPERHLKCTALLRHFITCLVLPPPC